jgi:hypothetical protein
MKQPIRAQLQIRYEDGRVGTLELEDLKWSKALGPATEYKVSGRRYEDHTYWSGKGETMGEAVAQMMARAISGARLDC